MSTGNRTLMARMRLTGDNSTSMFTLATCAAACTPASVRLAPATPGRRSTSSP